MEQDLYFETLEQYQDFLKQLSFLGSGQEGTCYRLKDKIIKDYYHFLRTTREEILAFQNLNIPTIPFPQAIAIVGQNIKGVIMNYMPGNKICQCHLERISFPKLMAATQKVIIDVRKLTDCGIESIDVCSVNILFDNTHFYFIDTVGYSPSHYVRDHLYYVNIRDFSRALFEAVSRNTPDLYHFIQRSKHLQYPAKNREWLENPDQFLEELHRQVSEYCDTDISSFGEANKCLTKCYNQKTIYTVISM